MKKGIVGIVLCLCILCGIYTLAENHVFSPYTVTEKSAQYVTMAKKTDDEQRWYVTVRSLSITENDKLYFNVRNAEYGTRLSKAISFTTTAAKSTTYTTATTEKQEIFLHAQLESSTWTPDSFAVISNGVWCP